MNRLFVSFLLLLSFDVNAQIVQQNGQIQYIKIFEETDDFGPEYLNVLEQSIESIKQDTLRFRVLNDLAYYYHTRNLKKSLEIINQSLKEVRLADNELWEGRMQVTQGAIMLRLEELDQAELALRSALQKLPEAETWLLLTNLGYVFERRGDLSIAFEYATKTLELGEKYKDKKAIAMAYSDISNLFWKQGKYESGVEYGLKSIAIFEERGIKDLDYDFTLHVLGNNLMELGRFEEALPYYQQSTEIGKQYGFYNNLSDTYIALTDLYSQMGDFKNAETSGKEALKYAELLQNDFMIVRSLHSLGKLKNKLGEYAAAVVYLERSIQTATADFGDIYYLSLIHRDLSEAFEGANRIEESLNAFKKYNELNQLVFNTEADQRIAQLQTEMDVNQKENIILLQNEELKKQEIIQLFTFILTAVMVLFLFLLYRVFIRRKKYSLLLEKQNKEKEFLLKEIHHRVKNNLETISSLLSLQTAQVDNAELRDIMRESQNRVQSMGIIHQNLYQGENLAAIEMKNYFENLGGFIIDSFDMTDRVVFECEMERMELNVDRAIPIGLIVNEIITNSLKYAFPNGRQGIIGISMREENSILHLSITDNGVGFSENPQVKGTGFGTQLIELLTRQLDGKMKLNKQLGTEVVFEFQLENAA
ncbi:tetratricopeptide repeat protein [Fulvivirgaceae bacterium LMO-SS25]